MNVFYLATMYLKHIKHITYFHNNNLTGYFEEVPSSKSEYFAYYNLSTHSLASFRHCMIHPCSYVSGNSRTATGWAYGGAWNQNDGKALTEGEARDRAEERSGRGAFWSPTKILKFKLEKVQFGYS